MINYLYDGSFEGLLTSIYEAYYRHEQPDHIYYSDYIQVNLLDTNIQITTDSEKAAKVYDSIGQKISHQALKNVYHAYLSELNDIEIKILNYVRLGFKKGKEVDLYLSDDRVLAIHTAAKKVTRECHLMVGLLRFKQLENDIYYAQYKPDHNITPLISGHFVDRFSDQKWVIHDVKRKYAAVYDQKSCIFTDISDEMVPLISYTSDNYEKLWKNYFTNICIKERINPKLQKHNMPVRYWEFLTEKNCLI
ncbi:TIGR03915 family putative DNA repair protein [Acetivibrio clariflavus]|mgnify:CR=1 FL=1|uniref:Putative DNA metabolism protein n=1 Tax=Acetivibrio clariflavus (strain DSM 19732 / NBRC 101661 / EBR45) TaxID=720554 RepID=G8M0H1_ACECE|nr:TIGR03915 family putative DNA repair protein [Acetivibrio clariflavus]AEV68016.1 putative DNA metabolism protein [Acetivibrio clariflavus DSM 19732]HOQ00224.1 TIGR03915 family putative DNA repair protein [Acetivibrio clariflavus]